MYNTWGNEWNGYYSQQAAPMKHLTKKDIKEIITYNLGATETISAQVGLQEIETRHICRGTTQIQKLPRMIYNVPTPQGSIINVNYFFCRYCGKLILDESSIEMV